MKPWEETWSADVWTHGSNMDRVWTINVDPKPAGLATHFAEVFDDDDARASLIAAAPEMARALLLIYGGKAPVSMGIIREALRSAGVIPSFAEEAAALESADT